jgi:hypothetical protein
MSGSGRWTSQETDLALRLLGQGFPAREISRMTGRTETAVRLKLLALGYSSSQRDPGAEELEADCGLRDIALEDLEQLREAPDDLRLLAARKLEVEELRRSERMRVSGAKEQILEQRIVDAFTEQMRDFRPPASVAPPPPPADPGESLTAVLVVSDAHIGQIVDPDEVEGLGGYNPAVALARIRLLEERTVGILRSKPSLERLLVLFGGDIVHGNLGHSLEEEVSPIAAQVDLALNVFFQFLVGLSQVVPQVEVHGVVGNHGRWPGSRKMPSSVRYSNLDGIFYGALASALRFSKIPSISFEERLSSRRLIEVGETTIQLQHGDEVRGGGFCTGGMNREVTNSSLRNLQVGRRAPTYFVMGDKHSSASLPYGRGAFIVNGSFVGADPFGLNFVPSPPSQTLFFLHPEEGKTETHEIRLDAARVANPLPYELKPSLLKLIEKFL